MFHANLNEPIKLEFSKNNRDMPEVNLLKYPSKKGNNNLTGYHSFSNRSDVKEFFIGFVHDDVMQSDTSNYSKDCSSMDMTSYKPNLN